MKYVDEVQPATIIANFKEVGITVSVEEAKVILEFMYMLADIALDIAENEIENSSVKPRGKFGNPTDD